MGLNLESVKGQTPLTEEEKEGLLIQSISTRVELDELEQQNIEYGIKWTMGKRFDKDQLISENFIKRLHKEMYGHVWSWAGDFRRADKNLGVSWLAIPVEVRKLITDCKYWIDHRSFQPEEIAVRFKHKLVQIHCFPNGNGRHSRLMADLILEKLFGLDAFSWGSRANLAKAGNSREEYIKAIKEADNNKIDLLVAFARK